MRTHQMLSGLMITAGLLAAPSAAVQAATQVWDFQNAQQALSGNNFGNTLSLTSPDGINLSVSAWSDTRDLFADDAIQSAELTWARSDSLGLRNRDEGNRNRPRRQRIDSITNDPDGEYDMVLLTFDQEVQLDGLDLALARGGSRRNTADLSVLAWDGTGSSALNGQTWSEVLSNNGGGYDVVGNYSDVGNNYFGVNGALVSSSQWLVGVYNPVFGTGGSWGDDSFAFSLLQTSTPEVATPVGAPGTLALAVAAMAGLRGRKRARQA